MCKAMYNGELSVGEFIVRCNSFSASCCYIMQHVFSLPRYENGILFVETPNNIMEDTMP